MKVKTHDGYYFVHDGEDGPMYCYLRRCYGREYELMTTTCEVDKEYDNYDTVGYILDMTFTPYMPKKNEFAQGISAFPSQMHVSTLALLNRAFEYAREDKNEKN